MKTIQEVATETRKLLCLLKGGLVKLQRAECAETLWDLQVYLANEDERECLERILDNIAGAFGPIDKIEEYFEPTKEDDPNELWEWFISDQSHVRLVEEAIRDTANNDLYKSISLALLWKDLEIFEAAKAYIMEVFKDQPDDEE